MTAEALRRRLAHGNVYAPEKIDAALSNYFRAGNLNALRELALLWTADRVDDALQQYREQHDITGTWEARERVVVALTGGPEGETLDPPGGADRRPVQRRRPARRPRRPLRRAGRSEPGRAGRPAAARRVARAAPTTRCSATTCPRRCSPSPAPRTPPSWSSATAAGPRWPGCSARARPRTPCARPATSTSTSSPTRHTGRGSSLPHGTRQPQHPPQGCGATRSPSLLPPLLTLALVPFRGELNLVSDMLLFLLLTVVVALVGGLAPALIAAVAGSVLLNYFFTPPAAHADHQRDQQRARAAGLRPRGGRWSARPSTSRRGVPGRRPARPPRRARWPTSPAACWAARRR